MTAPTLPPLQPARHSPVQTGWLALATSPSTHMDAYLALPPGGSGPGLLLLQEIFGVNPHIRAVAEQYAAAGFVVLAPDLFWRHAPRVELAYQGPERDQALALMKTIQRDTAVADMNTTLAALRSLPGCTGSLAALGYCMGGRLAFTAAALCPGLDRAVAYYGGGIAGQLDLAAHIRCPVLFHHAETDASIPPEAVAAIQTALQAQAPAAAQAQFFHYPGAQHGFNCWDRPAHHPASAAQALARSLNFLAEAHLQG